MLLDHILYLPYKRLCFFLPSWWIGQESYWFCFDGRLWRSWQTGKVHIVAFRSFCTVQFTILHSTTGVRTDTHMRLRESYSMISVFWIDTICLFKMWRSNVFQTYILLPAFHSISFLSIVWRVRIEWLFWRCWWRLSQFGTLGQGLSWRLKVIY